MNNIKLLVDIDNYNKDRELLYNNIDKNEISIDNTINELSNDIILNDSEFYLYYNNHYNKNIQIGAFYDKEIKSMNREINKKKIEVLEMENKINKNKIISHTNENLINRIHNNILIYKHNYKLYSIIITFIILLLSIAFMQIYLIINKLMAIILYVSFISLMVAFILYFNYTKYPKKVDDIKKYKFKRDKN